MRTPDPELTLGNCVCPRYPLINRKEFWWEREWRHVGAFELPAHIIVLCPECELAAFCEAVDQQPGRSAAFIDARWGLEQIISRLAGYSATGEARSPRETPSLPCVAGRSS